MLEKKPVDRIILVVDKWMRLLSAFGMLSAVTSTLRHHYRARIWTFDRKSLFGLFLKFF